MNLLVLGTCRAHRIFVKEIDGKVYDNTGGVLNPIFSHLGYLHSAFELRQLLEFFHSQRTLDFSQQENLFLFRKEPARATPKNEFNPQLHRAIGNRGKFQFDNLLTASSAVLIEICSWQYYKHSTSGLYLHANPNWINSYSYTDIYPDGYYEKSNLGHEIVSEKMTQEEIEKCFLSFSEILKEKDVFIMGHLVDPNNRNSTRHNLNTLLKKLCDKYKFNYIDTEKYVGEYGFLTLPDGNKDIHHLSHRGECALGGDLIETIKKSENILNNIQPYTRTKIEKGQSKSSIYKHSIKIGDTFIFNAIEKRNVDQVEYDFYHWISKECKTFTSFLPKIYFLSEQAEPNHKESRVALMECFDNVGMPAALDLKFFEEIAITMAGLNKIDFVTKRENPTSRIERKIGLIDLPSLGAEDASILNAFCQAKECFHQYQNDSKTALCHNDLFWSNIATTNTSTDRLRVILIDFGLISRNYYGTDLHHFFYTAKNLVDLTNIETIARHYAHLIQSPLKEVIMGGLYYAIARSMERLFIRNFSGKIREREIIFLEKLLGWYNQSLLGLTPKKFII